MYFFGLQHLISLGASSSPILFLFEGQTEYLIRSTSCLACIRVWPFDLHRPIRPVHNVKQEEENGEGVAENAIDLGQPLALI